ncbi:hypothetical protein [uncultured Nostoc sp.]|uniref:hypothetical protein n=1 Tax=uncultured Nostoc sp. TaxID=340711 RepID=UPI0035CB2BC9
MLKPSPQKPERILVHTLPPKPPVTLMLLNWVGESILRFKVPLPATTPLGV